MIIQVTETQYEGNLHVTPVSKLYNSDFMDVVRDENGNTKIEIKGINRIENRLVQESFATISTALLADTFVDEESVSVPAIRKGSTSTEMLSVHEIVEAYPNPDNSAQTLVRSRSNTKLQDRLLLVSRTVVELLGDIRSASGLGTSASKTITQTLNNGDNTVNHALNKVIEHYTVKDGNDFVATTGNIINANDFNVNLAGGGPITDATITFFYTA